MIVLLIKYWKPISVAIISTLIISGLLLYRNSLINKGYNKCENIYTEKTNEVINENIETRIRQDSIKRLDNDALINSLRNNTF